jgi:hypothetical protein
MPNRLANVSARCVKRTVRATIVAFTVPLATLAAQTPTASPLPNQLNQRSAVAQSQPLRAALTSPDLAFDVQAMESNIRRFPVIVKNVGNARSGESEVTCQVTSGAVVNGIPISNSFFQQTRIKALNPGERVEHINSTTQQAYTGYECTIQAVASERNTANNAFKWITSQAASPIGAELVKSPFAEKLNIQVANLKKADLALGRINYAGTRRQSGPQTLYKLHFSVDTSNIGELTVSGAKVECVVKYEYQRDSLLVEASVPVLSPKTAEMVPFSVDATGLNIGFMANIACELKTLRPQDDSNPANNRATVSWRLTSD